MFFRFIEVEFCECFHKMNLSINALRISNLMTSSFITMNTKTRVNNINIRDSYVYRSFYSFILSNQKLNLHCIHSAFKKYLDSVIKTNDLYIERQNFKNGLNNIYDIAIQCQDCKFIDCLSRTKGSAICASTPLKLLNCYFENCISEFGGALHCQDLDLLFCTFSKCSAKNTGSVLFIPSSKHVDMIYTGFHGSAANIAGIMHVCCDSLTQNSINSTQCGVYSSTGNYYYHKSSGYINFMIFNSLSSAGNIAGFYFKETKDFKITQFLGVHLFASGNDNECGIFFHGDSLVGNTTFQYSAFNGFHANRGYTAASYNPAGGYVILRDSCIRDASVSLHPSIITDNTSKFETNCDTYVAIMFYRKVGYLNWEKSSKSWFYKLTQELFTKQIRPIQLGVFVMGFLMIFVIIAIFNFIDKIEKKGKRK